MSSKFYREMLRWSAKSSGQLSIFTNLTFYNLWPVDDFHLLKSLAHLWISSMLIHCFFLVSFVASSFPPQYLNTSDPQGSILGMLYTVTNKVVLNQTNGFFLLWYHKSSSALHIHTVFNINLLNEINLICNMIIIWLHPRVFLKILSVIETTLIQMSLSTSRVSDNLSGHYKR